MRIILTLSLIAISLSSFSQNAVPSNMRAQFTLDQLRDQNGMQSGDMVYGVAIPPGRVVGDTYLDKKWNIGKILLYEKDKIIEGYPVRYDIKGDMLEIKSRKDVKVLGTRRIHSLVWIDSITGENHYFVNAKDYQLGGTPFDGFLEVLSDGKMPLMKRTIIIEKDPSYVAALDVGSRDTKLLKKSSFFYAVGPTLTKVGSKKSLLPAFGEHAAEMETYIKTNKVDLDNERSLTMLFDYYNAKFVTEAN